MRTRFLVSPIFAVLTLAFALPLDAQRLESRATAGPRSARQTGIYDIHDASTTAVRASFAVADTGRGLPHWVRWGLVGAAAGALAAPLLNSLSADPQHSTAGAAVEGAAFGFVMIGGSVALYDAVCRGDTSSRRAGLCGNRRRAFY